MINPIINSHISAETISSTVNCLSFIAPEILITIMILIYKIKGMKTNNDHIKFYVFQKK